MTISAATVKALRERTGAGMMDCKRALQEAGGDEEKAIKLLREKGMASAAKKASRAANEGMVAAYVSADGSVGALVEINCETDFVARTPQFQKMVERVVRHVAETRTPADYVSLEQRPDGRRPLLDQALEDGSGNTVGDLLRSTVGELGENMVINQFARFSEGYISTYIHPGSRIGSMVEIEVPDTVAGKPGFVELARDIAMQVAGHLPPAACVRREEVPAENLAAEKEVYRNQALNEGKPEKIIDRIVDGKVENYYKQVVLLEQVFIKDTGTTIRKLVDQKGKELGGAIAIRRFARFQVGG